MTSVKKHDLSASHRAKMQGLSCASAIGSAVRFNYALRFYFFGVRQGHRPICENIAS